MSHREGGLTINVIGKMDTGKTTTANIIAEALRDADYLHVQVIDAPSSKRQEEKDRWANRFERTKARKVTIVVTSVDDK